MFNDINEVRLLGNITNDPDLRFTPSGAAVLSFGMATNRRYKKGEEWVDEPTFHNIVIWGQRAQSLAQRVKKGTRLFAAGRVQTRSWDGNDGKKQYRTEIVVDDVSLVARYNEGPMGDASASAGAPARSSKSSKSKSEDVEMDTPAPEVEIADIDPDELPF